MLYRRWQGTTREKRSRITTLEEAYKIDLRDVCGTKYLLRILDGITPNAKDILNKIFRIIGKGSDPVQRLTHDIMNEHLFKTMKDNDDDIYYYDKEQGLYVLGAESLIKELCELMYPEISTHKSQEVINHIKRRTYVDRSKFDSNIDVINLENGLVNIRTLEFREHSPNELSLVQLPLTNDPESTCPD